MESSDDSRPSTRDSIKEIVQKNVRELLRAQKEKERARSWSEQAAEWIVAAAGTMKSAYLHGIWFGTWVIWNQAATTSAFDPYPYELLTTIVSLEAIFLTLFVLVSQNLQSQQDSRRAHLNLHVDLLAEHEITRILSQIDRISRHIGLPMDDSELEALERDITPAELLQEIDNEDADSRS